MRITRALSCATFLSALLTLATHALAGNVVLTGHDDDYHATRSGSTDALNQARAILIFVRSGAPDPTKPVLTFDHGAELTALLNALGVPFVNVDPDAGAPSASLFDVTRFSAIVVASDLTCGGCDNDPTSSANLAAASQPIAAFFGAGGGIAAFAGAHNRAYYHFVPATASGFGTPPSNGYTQTPFGASLGIPPVNGDPTHNFFFTPGTNGVSAAYSVIEILSSTGEIETVGCKGCGAAEIGAFLTFLGAPGTTTNPTGTYAEPVNTATGNYYTTHVDVSIPGRGLPFIFARAYNARDPYAGPLGAGWTHSYNIFLTQDSTGLVTIKRETGDSVSFKPVLGGTYTPSTSGLFDSLKKNSDGTFTLTRKDQTQLQFSTTGKLNALADRNGNAETFFYDGNGNLTTVKDAPGRVFSFAYDASGHLVSINDPVGRRFQYSYDSLGNLMSFQDALGGLTQYTYDGSHRMLSMVDARGIVVFQNTYDAQGRVVAQQNGRGFATTFAYDTPSPGTTTITDPRGKTIKHVYNTNLQLTSVVDALGGTVSYTYNINNLRLTVQNQLRRVTTLTYGSNGNLTSVTDPLGKRVTFSYDPFNDLLAATNPKGRSTAFSYDSKGNLKTIVDAAGNTTRFNYDSFGELVTKQDALGNSTQFTYGGFGDVVTVTDPLGGNTSLSYDGISRLLVVRDPNGHRARALYDALRLVTVIDPLGHATRFAYDAVGNLLKITDANDNSTTYGYDATNNLVKVTDTMGHVTNYGYDQNNNRTAFTNAKGAVTSYAFDAVNRLAQITDPLSFVTAYSYDAAGNVLSKKDRKGNLNRFAYDNLNRLAGISYADGKNIGYAYDADGKRITMSDWHGTTSYSYDALDRVTAVANPNGKVVQYAYDAIGHRTSLTYPDGKRVNYTYDPDNRLTQVQDWVGRTTRYSYDPAGNLQIVAYPNRTSIQLAYDGANRLVQVQNLLANAGFAATAKFTYQLDSVGNRLSVTNGLGFVKKYTYDPLYELTSVAKSLADPDCDGPDDTEIKYAYDAVGNRISQSRGRFSTPYTYDADDRLLKTGFATFTYDADGNQTSVSRTATAHPMIYRYDATNRLVSATGFVNSGFDYDGDGNRVFQSVGPATYNYVNDVATALPVVLQENGPDGNVSYNYGLNLISETSPSFEFFYQLDGSESVVGLTDSIGRLRARYDYDPWGQLNHLLPDSGGNRNKFFFTGQALDPGTQDYYLRARYYEAGTGRFAARDPLGGTARIPLSQNRYAYALSSPTTYMDRSGLAAEGFQFQSFLGEPALELGNAGSTLMGAPSPTSCSNCVPFALIGDIAGLGGDLRKAIIGNDVPGLDLAGVGLDVAQRLENGQPLSEALALATRDYAVQKTIGLAATFVAGATGGAILITAYGATKVGADIGSIPAVEQFVSQQEFSVLNWTFGPTRVEQWSTSPVWTDLSNWGSLLPNLP